MKKNNTLIQGLGIAVFAALLAGCATTVSFPVTRLPAWDTLGIRRIAVMPFGVSDRTSLQRQAAALLSAVASTHIQGINQFILIASSEVTRIQSSSERIENYVDALFSGQVISLTVKDNSLQETRINRETEEEVVYIIYEREVQMTFNYSLQRTNDGRILGIKQKSDIMHDSFEHEVPAESDGRSRQTRSVNVNLKSPEVMIHEIIARNMNEVARDLAPYTVIESRHLIKESSKDRIIKERSKNALAQVKNRNYRSAQQAFVEIYQETKSYAAAYNAGVLMEAQGDLSGAILFMQGVFNETGNPRAAAEVSRIQRAMNNAALAAAYSENQNRQNILIARMNETLPARIPAGARVAVVNNSQNERELAEAIANGIISGLLSKNITIVDRNNRALLETERRYQLSGFVNDAEIVNIGKEAGVNVFILIAVTGTSSAKFLSVRILDVERSTVLYQSPQTDEMKL